MFARDPQKSKKGIYVPSFFWTRAEQHSKKLLSISYPLKRESRGLFAIRERERKERERKKLKEKTAGGHIGGSSIDFDTETEERDEEKGREPLKTGHKWSLPFTCSQLGKHWVKVTANVVFWGGIWTLCFISFLSLSLWLFAINKHKNR